MSCQSGTPQSPLFGCCPEPENHIAARSWISAYTINAWGTPMSYLPAQEAQEVCVTGFYAKRSVELYNYTDFDINQPVLTHDSEATIVLPGGQLIGDAVSAWGHLGGSVITHFKVLEESETSIHIGAFRNHPDTEFSAVSSAKVTLSHPFSPEDFFGPVHAAIQSKFGEPWDPENEFNEQGPGPVPAMDWVAYYAKDNTLVCGHFIDIARERGLNDFNFFIPTPRFPGDGADVCTMEAYSFLEKTMVLSNGLGVNVGNNPRRYMDSPNAFYNKVWRRVEWAWFNSGPLFEWQRDDVSVWGPDGCTRVRSSACPRPFATRCLALPPTGTLLAEPPVDANTYGRRVWGPCT